MTTGGHFCAAGVTSSLDEFQCGFGSEVRTILAASLRCGATLDQ